MSITAKTAKVGSKIIVRNAGPNEGIFFCKGDTAILGSRRSRHGSWLADFSGNPWYKDDGHWYISEDRFEVIEE